MQTFARLQVTCVLTALTLTAAVRQTDETTTQMLQLQAGETLSACQGFYWKATRGASRYWISAGSCQYCNEIAHQDAGDSLHARLRIPADGRTVFVRLYAEVEGNWVRDDYFYRAPSDEGVESCESDEPLAAGVYHWTGLATRSVAHGVQAVSDLGGDAVRVALSPRYWRDYNISSECYPDFTLAKAVREPDIRQAFANPDVQTYMLTAFSGAGFGDCENQRFLRRAFYTPTNRARLVEEFAGLTYELYRTYAETGKQFILSNWESDNAVYCGAAYRYATEPEFRDACDSGYPEYYGGNASPAESIIALRQWFTARWEGIEKGRRRARSEGYRGVAVHYAPEISMVRGLKAAGLPSVLHDVIPDVPFDYVSYSAWESINRPELSAALAADLDTIRAVAGTEAIVLGEIGFSQKDWGEQAIPRTVEAIRAAADWGVPLAFQWVLFDYDPAADTGFGLFDKGGALTPTGSFYRRLFAEGVASIANE